MSKHSFSFGSHYQADNTHFGLLLASNEDLIQPRSGFDSHSHIDMEIVTWVLEGVLTHEDSEGNGGQLRPGLAQRLSAGAGVRHSERNEQPSMPTRVVQMWISPDERGGRPDYAQLDVSAQLSGGDLIPIASGLDRHRDRPVISLRQRAAACHVARLPAGATARLPTAPFVHLFVAAGDVEVGGFGGAGAGDALRLSDCDGLDVRAVGDSEILVWEMHASLS